MRQQNLPQIVQSMEPISFHPVSADILRALADIMNHYIEHTTVSFHTEKLSEEDMKEKVFFPNPAFRAFSIRLGDELVGFCAVSPWKKQQAYRHTGEINIYLTPAHTGKGIGNVAIAYLLEYAKTHDIQNLIAGLCSENYPSKRLFEKAGFEPCAHFRNVAENSGGCWIRRICRNNSLRLQTQCYVADNFSRLICKNQRVPLKPFHRAFVRQHC
jgi:phosphinothricin acetyltransferase